MNEEIFKEKGTRSMSDKELFTEQVSYSHVHVGLEGFVCPKCGWCVPKISASEPQYERVANERMEK